MCCRFDSHRAGMGLNLMTAILADVLESRVSTVSYNEKYLLFLRPTSQTMLCIELWCNREPYLVVLLVCCIEFVLGCL